MSHHVSIVEISSESDSDIECNSTYPFDPISKIELIEDDDDTIEDDDIEIVSITRPTQPAAPIVPQIEFTSDTGG